MMRFSAWYSILSVLVMVLAMPLEGQTQSIGDVLLHTEEVEGVLGAGDPTFADGSLYDIHSFQGQSEQAVIITAESDEFNTYLSLLDPNGEILSRNNDWNGETNSTIGYVLPVTGVYRLVVQAYHQNIEGAYRVTISGATPDSRTVRESQADRLNQQGLTLLNQSEYQTALELFQQSLVIYQTIGDRRGEGEAFNNIGSVFFNLGEYRQALDVYEKFLTISEGISFHRGEGIALNSMGVIYSRLGQYEKALEYYKQSLTLYQELGNALDEGDALNNIGITYSRLGQYEKALKYHEQALTIRQEIDDRIGEGDSLNSIGFFYSRLGQYPKALEFYAQSLAIRQEIGDRRGEGESLNNIGGIYDDLGQYQKALEYYEQSLAIRQEIGARDGERTMLSNIGFIYSRLGEYSKALELHERALILSREIGSRRGEGNTLNHIGSIYDDLGQYDKALEYYEQALAIRQEIGDRSGESISLNNIGGIYSVLGQPLKALDFYEQSLVIHQEVGDREVEGFTLVNLGSVFEVQEKAELAVLFYKQAINARAKISQSLDDPIARQSYLQLFTDVYDGLGNLLLAQGRLLEAQQILELFKLQELSDYTNDTRLLIELPYLTLLPEEEAVIDTYNRLLMVKQQLKSCSLEPCPNITNLQASRNLAHQEHQFAVEQLTTFIRNGGYQQHPLLRDSFFITQANKIIAQQPGTVLIYPLVLENKLWLLWVTEDGLNSYQVANVNQQTLTQTINAFRIGLENRYSDLNELQTYASQLYNWLVSPIESALNDSIDPSHLVLALDRNTRYIPIAALYDGQQYLIEKYDISTILAVSLTNVEERVPVGTDNISVLAAGVSEKVENFSALPNVPIELDTIVKERNNSNDQVGIYIGQQLLDPDFTTQTLHNSLSSDTRFLHIATHGEFVPGNRYSSYLLMGNGEKLPLPEIANLSSVLKDVHLAVLSACQTALGGADEEGLEIAGLGYYFFKSDVDAVMASLWNVNDASTSQFMQAFYQTLSKGTEAKPITKAEALRIAQLSLLQSNEPGNPGEERFRRIPKNPSDQPRPESGLAHPYYWAPFILIGNSL